MEYNDHLQNRLLEEKMNKQKVINHCLESLVNLAEYSLEDPKYISSNPEKIVGLLGEAIKNYENKGFMVLQEYKDRYNEFEKRLEGERDAFKEKLRKTKRI